MVNDELTINPPSGILFCLHIPIRLILKNPNHYV